MMSVVYLENAAIDKVKWDACVKNAINGNAYAYSWYLDFVSEGWNALVSEDYSYVFPLTWRKKMGIKYLFQPPFAQQLGVFSINVVNAEVLNLFFNAIPKEYKLIEINLNKFNNDIPDSFSQKENATYELDLNRTYEVIKANYTENTKRNIKKAVRNELYLSKKVTSESMINLFKENRGKDINTLKENDYTLLKKLINHSIINNFGEIWGAFTKQNELCAAAFFIEANGKTVFLFSSLNDCGRKNSAMFHIVDNYIRLNAARPLVFDFEGSNDEKIAHFYKGFGSKKYLYIHIYSNKLPYLVNLFRCIYKKLKFN